MLISVGPTTHLTEYSITSISEVRTDIATSWRTIEPPQQAYDLWDQFWNEIPNETFIWNLLYFYCDIELGRRDPLDLF